MNTLKEVIEGIDSGLLRPDPRLFFPSNSLDKLRLLLETTKDESITSADWAWREEIRFKAACAALALQIDKDTLSPIQAVLGPENQDTPEREGHDSDSIDTLKEARREIEETIQNLGWDEYRRRRKYLLEIDDYLS